jgi:hypothetical protein
VTGETSVIICALSTEARMSAFMDVLMMDHIDRMELRVQQGDATLHALRAQHEAIDWDHRAVMRLYAAFNTLVEMLDEANVIKKDVVVKRINEALEAESASNSPSGPTAG